MKLEAFWLSLLMFSGVAIGIGMYQRDVMLAYDPAGGFNSTSMASFDKFNRTFTDMEVTTSDLLNRSTSMAKKGLSLSTVTDVTVIIIDIVSVIAQTPNMLYMMMDNVFSMLPVMVPWWFKVMASLVIVVLIVVSVIKIFTKSGEL